MGKKLNLHFNSLPAPLLNMICQLRMASKWWVGGSFVERSSNFHWILHSRAIQGRNYHYYYCAPAAANVDEKGKVVVSRRKVLERWMWRSCSLYFYKNSAFCGELKRTRSGSFTIKESVSFHKHIRRGPFAHNIIYQLFSLKLPLPPRDLGRVFQPATFNWLTNLIPTIVLSCRRVE